MISFMGYSEKQLMQMIKFWEKNKVAEQAKLTRAEAIDLYKAKYPYPFTNNLDAAKVIDFFIAVGMLKVTEKEEKEVTTEQPNLTKADAV